MASQNVPLLTFNGGEVGRETLTRIDIEGYARFSETMENWLPLSQGPMVVRPPLYHQVRTPSSAVSWLHKFSYNVEQSFTLLFTANALRILQDGGIIARESVSTAIGNGDFTSLAAWTDISAGAGTATLSSNRLRLASNDADLAGLRQAITVAAGDFGKVHALEVDVERGPVTIRMGTTAGGSDVVAERVLNTGVHSIAFTPTLATNHLDIFSRALRPKYVEDISIGAAGDMVLATSIAEADFPSLRFEQSANTLFLTWGEDYAHRLERIDNSSWSLVTHEIDDGPFELENTNSVFTLTPGAVSGETTLTASQPLFSAEHVGGLFAVTHTGQRASIALASANVFSDPIRVVGVGNDRAVNIVITGTFVATITLQKSVGNTTDWDDVTPYTATTSTTQNDGLDNQIVYYRIGIKSGDYTSGSATATITNQSGTTTGVARIVGYTSSTVVDVDVITAFAKTDASADWAEGSISGALVLPSAVALFDGRLFLGGENKWGGSVSDDFTSFQVDETESSAIWRLNASGSVNPIQWFLPLARLLIGTDGTEHTVRSSTFDEALSPTNNALRPISSRGVGNVHPAVIDTFGFYIDRTTMRLMAMAYDVDMQDYRPRNMMRLHRRLGKPGLKQVAVARFPDTRLFLVRNDGVLIVFLFNTEEEAQGYARITTTGYFESVSVEPAKPGEEEDKVYVVVRRTIGGSTVRSVELLGDIEWDTVEDAGTADAAVWYDGVAATTIPGGDHIIGETVVVWADGSRRADAVVDGSGNITIDEAASQVLFGIATPPARYKSGKLAYAARGGTALAQMKRVVHVSIGYFNTVLAGVRYGGDFTTMNALLDRDVATTYDSSPGIKSGETKMLPCPARHDMDGRLCLEVQAPFRAQISHVVLHQQTNEKVG